MRDVGIEEEFLLFAADGPRLIDVGPDVAADAERESDDDAQFEKELKQVQAELATSPTNDLQELAAELAERRSQLADAARERGARLVAAGTSPVRGTTRTTDDPRYRQMAHRFAAVERRQLTCAMHVHVSIESDDEGAAVLNGIAPWLPLVTALSSNSPFHDGQHTGYASYRRVLWGQWPTAGPTASFADGNDYRRTVDALVTSGAARDAAMIYFDARLSAQYPTVEIRVCDVAIDTGEAVMLAALCRALVETAAGTPPPDVRPELLRAAAWRAARWGMTERLVAPGEPAPRLIPAWEAVETLLDRVGDPLRAAGDYERVAVDLQRLRKHGTGAQRQRRAAGDEHALGRAIDVAVVQPSSRNRGSTSSR